MLVLYVLDNNEVQPAHHLFVSCLDHLAQDNQQCTMLWEHYGPLNSKDLLISHQRTASPNDSDSSLKHVPSPTTNSQPL